MKRLIVNCVTLIRIPVIVLLVLSVFSLGWDSPEFLFWLYIIGLLSHGLDGVLDARLKPPRRKPKDQVVWETLDTMVLSLGLQLAAAAALFHLMGVEWWVAIGILGAYVGITVLIEGMYIQRRKAEGRSFVPLILLGSGVVWLGLGGALAYQGYELWEASFWTVYGIAVYGFFHSLLHPALWKEWSDEAKGRY